jgi:prepilin-type N-terminal cleavage/methylation domain-containing protein
MTQRGLTLVELLIVVMLLATALVAAAASAPLLMQAVTVGGLRTTATLLAQQCLERARTMPYERVLPDLEAICPADPPGYPGFRRTVAVTAGSPTAATTTVVVRVDVRTMRGAIPTTVATVVAP